MRTFLWGSFGMVPLKALCLKLIEDTGALKQLDAFAVTVPQLICTVVIMSEMLSCLVMVML